MESVCLGPKVIPFCGAHCSRYYKTDKVYHLCLNLFPPYQYLYTVKLGYNELGYNKLGYNELPVITNIKS